MRKKYIFLGAALLLSSLSMAQSTDPAPYCAAGYDDDFMAVEHYISEVSLGTLTNSSGTTQASGNHYIFYNNLATQNFTQGSNYNLSVSHDGGSSIHFIAVYIDFNKDGDFDDANERVMQYTINDPNTIPNPATTVVTIPANAATGVTRMRVMVIEDDEYTWGASNTNATPCTADGSTGGSLDWGETEDYNINITALTGIENQSISVENISVSPNPASNMIEVAFNNQNNLSTVNVLNINGQKVNVPIINRSEKSVSMDISSIASGIYFIEIQNNQGVGRVKFNKL